MSFSTRGATMVAPASRTATVAGAAAWASESGRFDETLRPKAGRLCRRGLVELDRTLVPPRRRVIAERHRRRVHGSAHRGTRRSRKSTAHHEADAERARTAPSRA